MVPASGDLALGLGFVKELAERHKLPYVTANLDCGGSSPFPAGLVIERGGQKVGVIGVVGNAAQVEGCLITQPQAAVQQALTTLGPVDVVVVLSSQRTTEDEELAREITAIDFVVNGADRKDFASPRPLPNNGLLLAAGSRGKKVGVLSFSHVQGGQGWRDSGTAAELAKRRDQLQKQLEEFKARAGRETDAASKERLEKRVAFLQPELEKIEAELAAASTGNSTRNLANNELVELGADVADHPATQALVVAAKQDITTMAAAVSADVAGAYTGPFVGSSACQACHTAETAQWASTQHATAYASLQKDNRHMEQDCYTCHVTGAFHVEGPKTPVHAATFANVGCESCHGPGRDHVADPTAAMVAKPETTVCTTCHDGLKDEGRFNLESYYPKVVHTAQK